MPAKYQQLGRVHLGFRSIISWLKCLVSLPKEKGWLSKCNKFPILSAIASVFGVSLVKSLQCCCSLLNNYSAPFLGAKLNVASYSFNALAVTTFQMTQVCCVNMCGRFPPFGTVAERILQTAIALSSSENIKKVQPGDLMFTSLACYTPIHLSPTAPAPSSSVFVGGSQTSCNIAQCHLLYRSDLADKM